MNSSIICDRCKVFTSLSYFFSCNHSFCSHCIIRLFAFTHTQTIIIQDKIQITCTCQEGTKFIKVTDLPQILDHINTASTNGAADKFHYLQCETQKKRIEILQRDFSYKVDNALKKTMQKLDELNQMREESKLIYNEKMKQTLQRANILLDMLRFCYLDFIKINRTLDIHLHKDISIRNIEVLNLHLKDETEKKIIQLGEDLYEYLNVQRIEVIQPVFKNYLQMQPLEAIHANDWMVQRDLKKNTLILTGHDDWVSSIIQMKDGRIASGSGDCTIKVWEEREHVFMNSLTLTGHDGQVCSLIQMKDGRIASGSGDRTIKVWEIREKEFKDILTLTGHNGWIYSLIQMKDGRIASGSNDKTIKVWELKKERVQNTLTLTGHNDSVCSLIHLEDRRIVSGSDDRTIKVWVEREHAFQNTMTVTGHNWDVCSLMQMDDGRIVSGSGDCTIKVWEIKEKDLKNTMTLIGHSDTVWSLIQIKDGRIASGSHDNSIIIWEIKEKEFKNTLTLSGHGDGVWSLIQMKDGRIASGTGDSKIKIWE